MFRHSKSAPDFSGFKGERLSSLPGDLKGKPIVRGAVMDKSMRDKKMGVSAYFGTELAHRMRENNLKPAKLAQSDELRHVLHMLHH